MKNNLRNHIKKAYISIKTIQSENRKEEADKVEMYSEFTGNYRKLPGMHCLQYNEVMHDDNGNQSESKVLMKIYKEKIVINKRGSINTCMTFINNTLIPFDYVTAYGSMRMETDTKELSINVTEAPLESEIEINVRYNLLYNGSELSFNEITFKVRIGHVTL